MISVIVPTFNRKEDLARCVDALVEQNYPRFEVIVVDDGGEVDLEIPEGVRLVRQPHAGRSVARNTGIGVAHGDIIAFTDDDCVVSENWLAGLARYFDDPEIVGVSGAVVYVAENYMPARDERRVENPYGKWPMTANIAYRKSVLKEVGGFDETFSRYEDKELALRAWQHGKIVAAPEVSVYHQKVTGPFPDWSMVDSSAQWLRLRALHDLALDKNNPAPFFGRVLMPKQYRAIVLRLLLLPALATGSLFGWHKAKTQTSLLGFLLLERWMIWKTAMQTKKSPRSSMDRTQVF